MRLPGPKGDADSIFSHFNGDPNRLQLGKNALEAHLEMDMYLDDDLHLWRMFEADCMLRKLSWVYALDQMPLFAEVDGVDLPESYLRLVQMWRSDSFDIDNTGKWAQKIKRQETPTIHQRAFYTFSNSTMKSLRAFFVMMCDVGWKAQYPVACIESLKDVEDCIWAIRRYKMLKKLRERTVRYFLLYENWEGVFSEEEYVPVCRHEDVWQRAIEGLKDV